MEESATGPDTLIWTLCIVAKNYGELESIAPWRGNQYLLPLLQPRLGSLNEAIDINNNERGLIFTENLRLIRPRYLPPSRLF